MKKPVYAVRTALKQDLRKAKAIKNTADRKGKLSFLDMKVGALESAADEVISAQNALLAVLDEDLRGGYEKMRGLLSYWNRDRRRKPGRQTLA